MRPLTIDLNADLGEGYPNDAQLMKVVTSANICSGAYIANDAPVKEALVLAKANKVTVGIHVGYPDVEGFGRTRNFMSPAEFELALDEQVNAFLVLAKAAGVEVSYLKPHGALYHDLIPKSALWTILLKVCFKHDWPVVHLAGSDFLNFAAQAAGAIHEGFIDRKYESASKLVPRSEPGAVLADEASVLAQAQLLAGGRLRLNDDEIVALNINTLCLHGDTPGAVHLGKRVREKLLAENFRLSPYERVTVLPYGPNAWIIRINEQPNYDLTKRLSLAAFAFKELPSIIDARISYNEILIETSRELDRNFIFEKSKKALGVPMGLVFFPGSVEHTIWTDYTGEDMDHVMEVTKLSRAEIIRLHTQQKFTVYALGFQPGFAFLGTLPLQLQIPRRANPRARVPANSVAIAADQTAIYPHASPGGWHLIGVATSPIFDADSPTLCPFKPGDTVQFKDISTR